MFNSNYAYPVHVAYIFSTLVGDSWTDSEGLMSDSKNQSMLETELLNSVNRKDIRARKEIFKHPLVQFFVEAKYSKMNLFMIASVVFNVRKQCLLLPLNMRYM